MADAMQHRITVLINREVYNRLLFIMDKRDDYFSIDSRVGEVLRNLVDEEYERTYGKGEERIKKKEPRRTERTRRITVRLSDSQYKKYLTILEREQQYGLDASISSLARFLIVQEYERYRKEEKQQKDIFGNFLEE